MNVNVRDKETGKITMVSNIGGIEVYDGAGFHNSIYRGKNLGTEITPEQCTAIKSGKFTDLYIGDYWEGELASGLSEKWIIAHFDYNFRIGECWTHHVVIVPERSLELGIMMFTTDSDAQTKGLKDSNIYVNYLSNEDSDLRKAMRNTFGEEHIFQFGCRMSTSVNNSSRIVNYQYTNVKAYLMSEKQVFGTNFYACDSYSSNAALPNNSPPEKQFRLFILNPKYIVSAERRGWWLSTIPISHTSRSKYWCITEGTGPLNFDSANASYGYGIRPYFCICG